jgi:hypothetical protein
MIDALRLFAGWALVWAFGVAIVVAISHGVRDRAPGVSMWTIGCGFFAGAFMLTVWMRAVSLAGIPFSLLSVGLPVLLATALLRLALATAARHRRAFGNAARIRKPENAPQRHFREPSVY